MRFKNASARGGLREQEKVVRVRVFGQYIQSSIAALAAIEMLVLLSVMIVAVLLRFQTSLAEIEADVGPLWPRVLLFGFLTVLCLFALGLYSTRQRAQSEEIFVRLMIAVGVSTALTTVSFYVVPSVWIGRGVLAIAAITALVVLLLTRAAFGRVFDENLFKRRILIYGTGERAIPVSRLRRRSDQRGFVVAGFVQPQGEECCVGADRVLKINGTLFEYCRKHDIDEVVVAMSDRRRAFPVHELLECRLGGIEVTQVATFLERETGRVCVDVVDPSWLIFGEGFRRGTLRLFSSRALDIAASLAVFALTLPLMLLTILAIKLEDGWRAPVFYRQVRVGLGGRAFPLLKFRSMRTDAESDGKPKWAQQHDPRVTRVGAVIRKLRIDELPQILNVLRGHMSFVGPRPERPEFVEDLAAKIPYYVERHSVKPGITGWAQLCYPYGASERDALEKLQYDLYYIKNNTLLFDMSILLQTAEVVFMGKGR